MVIFQKFRKNNKKSPKNSKILPISIAADMVTSVHWNNYIYVYICYLSLLVHLVLCFIFSRASLRNCIMLNCWRYHTSLITSKTCTCSRRGNFFLCKWTKPIFQFYWFLYLHCYMQASKFLFICKISFVFLDKYVLRTYALHHYVFHFSPNL